MRVTCYFDGSTEPKNPYGHTSYGALVKINGRVVLEESGYVGVGEGMSNNVGEYSGAIAVMEYLIKKKIYVAVIFGDSRLVVRQMNKKMKARSGMYMPYFIKARKLKAELPDVKFIWIPREQNSHADYLSRQAIRNVPQANARREELMQLIREQKADAHDQRLRFEAPDPEPIQQVRVIKKAAILPAEQRGKISARKPTYGASRPIDDPECPF